MCSLCGLRVWGDCIRSARMYYARCLKLEGEKAVCLGLGSHTSRSYNTSVTACVVLCLECVVLLYSTKLVLSTRHNLAILYVANP